MMETMFSAAVPKADVISRDEENRIDVSDASSRLAGGKQARCACFDGRTIAGSCTRRTSITSKELLRMSHKQHGGGTATARS